MCNLFNNSLEHFVGRHIIELAESCVNALWVLERHISLAIGTEDTLRLATEHNFLDALDIRVKGLFAAFSTTLLFTFFLVSERKLVVHYSLALVTFATVVTRLHKLLDQPLHDRVDLGVIETLDLLRGKIQGALHNLKGIHDLFRELDLLTHDQVISEFDINVEVRAGDTPAHTSQDLIEGVNCAQTSAEVTSGNEYVADLLKKFLSGLLLHVSDLSSRALGLKHLYILYIYYN